ncbi:MAG: hypothetical protein PHH04_02525 [Thomasclavelia sp.]|nr:hypothetical protein [Thomasclavelia sp.]
MKMYFENFVTSATSVMLIGMIGFIIYTIVNRNNIDYWGRRVLFVAAFGLLICCFGAARDGLDKTIQFSIDGSCNPGIFSLTSIPIIIASIAGGVIFVTGIATLFLKTQDVRQILFYIMSSAILIKIVVIEIGRIIGL